MLKVKSIFERVEKLTHEDGQREFVSVFTDSITENLEQNKADHESHSYQLLKAFLQKIIDAINELSEEIKNDDALLISVKNQKLLRTCFQLVTSLGISPCLIPGLGISLSKRCSTSSLIPSLALTDEQKYEMLVNSTNLFSRSYKIPVLKNIITTLHLSDYLAALIQLSFAPLKKPGTYNNFIMTQEIYDKLTVDRQQYVTVYEHLVSNCFQPTIMKELLVLQSVTNPCPPAFVRKVIAKEMSRRLLSSGGLLSLIRCFIESYSIDTGYEWKKVEMVCKIVTAKHGNSSENLYVNNISAQLGQILSLNNTHYLATAVACLLSLNEKYSQSDSVMILMKEIFHTLDYDRLVSKSNLPGTIILSPQEVEHQVNVLHACVCTKSDAPVQLLMSNLYVLFLIGIKCTKHDELKVKLRDIILKCLEKLSKDEVTSIIRTYLFGKNNTKSSDILMEEYDSGVAIKSVTTNPNHPRDENLLYFLNLFKGSTDNQFVHNVFEVSLLILIELSTIRQKKVSRDMLLIEEGDQILLDEADEQYAVILQLLSEISESPKVINILKTNPSVVLQFIEHFILKEYYSNEECATIALVLLNTVLSHSNKSKDLENRFCDLIPVLKKIAGDSSSLNHILSKEALSLITSESFERAVTPCEKALADVFDNLLPVRAHGLMELTKLIDAMDPETISKKHYIFCLFQEQLKDSDSYIYLAAINGLASLCTHCTEDVLHVLCKEFLQISTEQKHFKTKDSENKMAKLRMKIGDVIVKVTKRLGEMAIVHKTILLNTMLCGCRDEDPLMRTSALSNLAEIALVLHYRIGSIIYEVLLCIWSIIETDKAIECRRAAVMVISSLIKGLGKETLLQLKENLLPVYRTLKNLYKDPNEDEIVRLHAQIGLEELNDVVNQFLLPEMKMEKQIFITDKHEDVFK